MTRLPESGMRGGLRSLHIIAVCGWIGGGLAILILLQLAGPATGAEIVIYQRCINALDNFLIIPSAGLSTVSGLLLSVAKPWGLSGHRWITEKCVITTLLLAFGSWWLAPGLQSLAPPAAFSGDPGSQFHQHWLWGSTAAILQTVLLLLLVGLSIAKPEKSPAFRRRATAPRRP